MALTSTSATDGCSQCAAALLLSDEVGPVGTAKNKAEEDPVDQVDGEGTHSSSKEMGKKDQDGAEKNGGCLSKKQCKKLWHNTQMKLWGTVESKYFNRGIMIAILINTISMGIEHHEQVQTTTPPVWF